MLRGILDVILDALYPPRCPVCLGRVREHGEWCPACLKPVLMPRQVNLVQRRLRHLDACLILCDYSGGVRKTLHRLKFEADDHFEAHFEWLLTRHVGGDSLSGAEAVVPVPLHESRLAERGFNQNERIFRKWAGKAGLIWIEPLSRIRATVPQWDQKLAERRKNIKGAFAVTRPEMIAGKSILLVDDILTSGSTLEECARVLKRGGAHRVTGLAIAGGAWS